MRLSVEAAVPVQSMDENGSFLTLGLATDPRTRYESNRHANSLSGVSITAVVSEELQEILDEFVETKTEALKASESLIARARSIWEIYPIALFLY